MSESAEPNGIPAMWRARAFTRSRQILEGCARKQKGQSVERPTDVLADIEDAYHYEPWDVALIGALTALLHPRTCVPQALQARAARITAERRRVRVRPPQPEVKYAAYVDMSGGSSDAAVLSIGHREGTLRVVDGVWDQGTKPPFDPKAAIPRFARILAEYRIGAVHCDTYGRKAPTLDFEAAFAACGITFRPSPFSASELYELMEVPLNPGELVLPDDPETLEQFAGLQRRGVTIDHRAGEHDDRANAVAGLCWLLGQMVLNPIPLKDAVRVGGERVTAKIIRPTGNPFNEVPSPWASGGGQSVFDAYDRNMLPGQSGRGGRRSW